GFEGDGAWRSSNDFLSPDSLFTAQVKDRLGEQAAARLQLMRRSHEESTNPSLERAQELAAASHKPALGLIDYITSAATREPIPTAAGDAKSVDEIRTRTLEPTEAKSTLLITNGWLTCGGKLLVGGSANV